MQNRIAEWCADPFGMLRIIDGGASFECSSRSNDYDRTDGREFRIGVIEETQVAGGIDHVCDFHS